MKKRRVFISHSTKDQKTPDDRAALEVQQALLTELRKSGGFEPLMDRISLEPGDAWRARINLWVGGCDAAVVLLSTAALDSAYVAYETSILHYRKLCDPRFPIIPVLVAPVTVDDVTRSRLAPQQLAELGFAQGSTGEVVAQVMEKLAEAEYGESPVERCARRLAELLRPVPDDVLDAAAEEIDLELGEWVPVGNERRRLRLAVQLMSVGMKDAVSAVLVLRRHLHPNLAGRERAVGELITQIASSWVDIRSTARIPEVARRKVGNFAVALNASRADTANVYLGRVRQADKYDWYVATCNAIFGEDPLESLSAEVSRILTVRLGVSEASLRKVLKNLHPEQPVVVVLGHEGIDAGVLDGLRERFPCVTFFLLTGDSAGAGHPLSEAEVEFLVPELARDDETRFLDQYEIFHDKLWPRD